MRYDVAVIGGGVIGCAIARELSRYRLRAVVIERDCEVGLGTSKANSGIIHAGHHGAEGTLKGELEWRGNQMWDALADDLHFGFKRIGDLTCAFDEDQRATLRQIMQQGKRRGVPGLELWGPERIRREEPHLSHDIVEALYAPTAGVVNPYEACFMLGESAVRNGVDLALEHTVTNIRRSEKGFDIDASVGDDATPTLIKARFVVDAAGLHADAIADMVDAGGFRIRARKGEEYLLDKRLVGYVKRVVFPCPTPTSKGILVIPTYDGTLMVGPTATWADKGDLTTTAEGSAEVFAGARKLAPGISEKDCIAEFAGLRAVSDTEEFVLGPSRVAGFVLAAGMQSPALTAAPAVATVVLDALRDDGLELVAKDDFEPGVPAPVRFAELSTAEQRSLVARDPAYARLVCRCEIVTEGEVRDAIDRGARTLDGIKFRTRAGMGRCQGGFCTWGCMELLHERLGIPLTAVTKRGGDSWVAMERLEGTA
ncbi:MAG: NAD(P)/FAD-dependent oxidoreductase [Trueperaceae bacterium]|nr:NAD(P)/FAD-dependent oxidoreductase [Trueperaceae bacterium]